MHSFSFCLILNQTNQHFDKTTWKKTSDRVSIGCPPSFYRDPIMKQQSVTKRTLDRWEIRAATGKSGVPLPGWGIRCIKVIEFSWNLATVTSFFLYVWAHSGLCDSILGTTPTNSRAAIVRVDDDGDFAGCEFSKKNDVNVSDSLGLWCRLRYRAKTFGLVLGKGNSSNWSHYTRSFWSMMLHFRGSWFGFQE